MDDLDDVQESEFITDTDEQDSLDERIDNEQRLRNQQLWASFQSVACCITKLYKDRTQPNISPWVPFQNAASNLTTLYKDCIESQRRFARIGYQVGRRRRRRDINEWLKKHKLQVKNNQPAQQQQQLQLQQQQQQQQHQQQIEQQGDSEISGNSNGGDHNNNTNGNHATLGDEQSMQVQQPPLLHFQGQQYQSTMQFGTRKRSCQTSGGNVIKRLRE